jgi:DNA polymerase-3 subunit delta
MVAIKSRESERFIAQSPNNVFLFLIYGPDGGMVRERALRVIDKRVDDRNDPFQYVELSNDLVATDPLSLLDEANTVPLFGGRRAILIEAGAKSIIPAITSLIAAPPDSCTIIITAGVLKKDSPLRKLIEGADLGASIECQADTQQDLHALIDRNLLEAGLVATAEARELLLNALGEDRLMSRSELNKLTLYMHGHQHVDAADVEAIVAHASNIASDRIIASAFSGNAGEAVDAYFEQGGDAGALLFGALRYGLALHRARVAIERESGRLDPGLTMMMRAGFGFMHRGLLEEQLKAWSSTRLGELLDPLREAQTSVRAHAARARMEAERALWRIAQTARRQSR